MILKITVISANSSNITTIFLLIDQIKMKRNEKQADTSYEIKLEYPILALN